VQWVPGLSRG